VTETLGRPYVVAVGEARVSVSLGIALAMDADDSAEALLRDADLALHHAKQRGKNCHEIFDEAMRRRASIGLIGDQDLVRAVEGGRLTVRCEPIVALDSGSVVGVEARPRWRGAGRDELPGEEALGTAPSPELLSSFHAWLLGDATKRALAVPGALALAEATDRRIHIILGSSVLAQPSVLELIRRSFELAEIPAAQVVLEISERTLMEQSPRLGSTLTQLAGLGTGLVVADFGTGYASLGLLRRFPIEGLKLCRSLIDGIVGDARQASTVKSLVELAHTMGHTVGATGVVTYDQVVMLHTLGCDVAQGPYFANVGSPSPVPAQSGT
jgi:EAL domain-containing protein (putative c-di-GMP-specific phosphodiesterase class I)